MSRVPWRKKRPSPEAKMLEMLDSEVRLAEALGSAYMLEIARERRQTWKGILGKGESEDG